MKTETFQRFCSTDETRSSICVPFGDEKFTYATDGRIAIRVPIPCLRYDPLVNKSMDQLAAMFAARHAKEAHDIHGIKVPEPEFRLCPWCQSPKGCDECDWTGKVTRLETVLVGGTLYSAQYIRLIQETLTGVRFYHGLTKQFPAYFSFDEGEGLLMPVGEAPKTTL